MATAGHQVASLFAKMGFQIDMQGLTTFDKVLQSVKKETTGLGSEMRRTNTQLNAATRHLKALKTAGGSVEFKSLSSNYVNLKDKVLETIPALQRFASSLLFVQPRITTTESNVRSLGAAYAYLRSQISQANAAISQTRTFSGGRPPVINMGGGHSGGGGGIGGGGVGGGGGSPSSQNGFLNSMQSFLRPFTPVGMMAGGAVAAGVVGREVKEKGQDQMKMENLLMFASENGQYEGNLKFVRDLALKQGLNSSELGRAFAQVDQSSRDKLNADERKKMFVDMSKYLVTTGADTTDQKLIFKAVNQMFSLGRIMAEEMNQLTERGVPRKMIHDVAKEVYGVKTTAEVLDLQKKGQLDPAKIIPLVMERFAKKADESGAYDKMMNSSIAAEGKFKESFAQKAKELMDAGLDKFLKNIFDFLTKALPILMDFFGAIVTIVNGWVDIFKGIYWFLNELWENIDLVFQTLVGWAAFLTTAFVAATGSIFGAATAGATLKTVLIGALKAVWLAIKRFPLITMFVALTWIFNEIKKMNEGKDSWAGVLSQSIQLALAHVGLLWARMRLLWYQVTSLDWAKAWKTLRGEEVDEKGNTVDGTGQNIFKRMFNYSPLGVLKGTVGELFSQNNLPTPSLGGSNLPVKNTLSNFNETNPAVIVRGEVTIKNPQGEILGVGSLTA